MDRSITDSLLSKNEILVGWLGAIIVVVHSNISGSGCVITSWKKLGESCCLDALVLIVVGSKPCWLHALLGLVWVWTVAGATFTVTTCGGLGMLLQLVQ